MDPTNTDPSGTATWLTQGTIFPWLRSSLCQKYVMFGSRWVLWIPHCFIYHTTHTHVFRT